MPMTLNDITVPYEILTNSQMQGAFQGKMDANGREDTVSFLIQFSDLDEFLRQIKGKPTGYGSGTAATVTRTEMLRHPWNTKLYATGAAYRSVGSDNSVSIERPWAECIVSITFGALPWFPNDPSQPFISSRIRGSSRLMTIPGTGYTFAGTGEFASEQDIGFRVGGHYIEVSIFELPDLNSFVARAIPLEGAVNSVALTVDGVTYPEGQLMFETFSAEWVANGLGARKAKAAVSIVYSDIPWNSGIRISDHAVDELVPAIYRTADFSTLFTY